MSRSYRFVLICLCGLVFLVGALLFRNCLKDARKYWNASTWPTIAARVTSTRISEYNNPQAERIEYERESAFSKRTRRVTHHPGEPDTYFQVDVRYQYDVGGNSYHGEINDSPHLTRAAAEDTASRSYPPGANVEIAYDPTQPENHWAYGDSPSPLGIAAGGMAMGAVFMLPLLVFAGYKLQRALRKLT